MAFCHKDYSCKGDFAQLGCCSSNILATHKHFFQTEVVLISGSDSTYKNGKTKLLEESAVLLLLRLPPLPCMAFLLRFAQRFRIPIMVHICLCVCISLGTISLHEQPRQCSGQKLCT